MLWKHILNRARLLSFNVCLICIFGYFLLKGNVEKLLYFGTDGFVLESVSHSEMVKGHRGQRTLVLCLKSKLLLRALKDIVNVNYYNLLVQTDNRLIAV